MRWVILAIIAAASSACAEDRFEVAERAAECQSLITEANECVRYESAKEASERSQKVIAKAERKYAAELRTYSANLAEWERRYGLSKEDCDVKKVRKQVLGQFYDSTLPRSTDCVFRPPEPHPTANTLKAMGVEEPRCKKAIETWWGWNRRKVETCRMFLIDFPSSELRSLDMTQRRR